MAGMVDVAWGLGVAGVATFFAARSAEAPNARRIAICLVVWIWALRLSGHVYFRLRGSGEDGRYQQMMEDWGEAAQAKLFGFFQLQAAASCLFAIPMGVALTNTTPWSLWDTLGVAIGLSAITGESIADWQLSHFKRHSDDSERVCDWGLWRYSRHPNYFFEWLHWWTYLAFAVGASYGWINLAFPMVMLYFILFKTGIPPAEAQSLRSRGDAYRRYQARDVKIHSLVSKGVSRIMMSTGMQMAERGYLPDALVRWGIRRLCESRLQSASRQREEERELWIESCRQGPIALATDRANEQHYEVPAEFFATVLGDRKKYSSAYWPEGVDRLERAEVAMLDLTCHRAELEDGMRVLDLGCGWGALTLWVAENYPPLSRHGRLQLGVSACLYRSPCAREGSRRTRTSRHGRRQSF